MSVDAVSNKWKTFLATPSYQRELLRSLALAWLDWRDEVLITLSGDDGEWPDAQEHGVVINALCAMRTVMEGMQHAAKGSVEEGEVEALVRLAITEQAAAHGFPRDLPDRKEPAEGMNDRRH